MEGPGICVPAAPGYVKPLDMTNSKGKDSGNLNVSYSADGTVGGKFVATLTVTYNAPLSSPPNWKYLGDDAANYCDTKPTIEEIAGGKGKYFQCTSKKLEAHMYAKSKVVTAKNVIDCSSQSEKKPEVDSVCKSLTQL